MRGQLEPYDPRCAKGWRYIQTTDTTNQLKVLLPPGTAAMYDQLLKFEAFELRKKPALSWERILQIRHLKDRMVRKCQKLAKSPSDQTIIAPPDFRVKAMEKWFKEQQKRTNALLHPHPPSRSDPHSSNRCPQCLPSDITRPPRPIPKQSIEKPSSQSKPMTAPLPPPRRSVSSPLPLPHLLRIRDLNSGYDLSIDPQRIVSLPENSPHALHDTPPSEQSPPPQKKQLPRRRSCIKRASTGDFAKTVSWADDRGLAQQLSDYASVALKAQISGHKWEDIRDIYVEQMNGLEALQEQVEQCMEHLRSESEHLKRADETIRRQREILQSTFEDFEKKQLRFKVQVQEALDDADHILSLTTKKDAPT